MGTSGNPYHDPKTGEFTSSDGAGSGGGGGASHANVPSAHGEEVVPAQSSTKLPYGGKAGQTYPYSHLSSTALKGAYDKHKMKGSAINQEMIDAGRGYEKPSETRTKSDPLSQRKNAASDVHSHLVTEMQRRESAHGSLKPLRESVRKSFTASTQGRF